MNIKSVQEELSVGSLHIDHFCWKSGDTEFKQTESHCSQQRMKNIYTLDYRITGVQFGH